MNFGGQHSTHSRYPNTNAMEEQKRDHVEVGKALGKPSDVESLDTGSI